MKIMTGWTRSGLIGLALILAAPLSAQTATPDTVENLFAPEYRNYLVMQVEAAIAEAQAEHGVISPVAAAEIRRTASPEYAPLDDVAAEYRIVRHRMVALLNVWRRALGEEAAAALHFGATTVDIYDTVSLLQLRASIGLMRADMLAAEAQLTQLAAAHRDTAMAGRTLGQHALPITFGKKVAVWAAANRRNVERLNDVECRLVELGVFRGAVGTHVGLGPKGREIERSVAQRLGLGPTEPADWHGMRDVFAEYAAALAIMSRTYAGIGDEIFTMQMTDIGEVYERRRTTAVSSSSMPHKRNPSRSEALIHYGRVIPATASILMDDVANVMERDNTSRPNGTLAQISIDAADMISDLKQLIARLEVDEVRIAENLKRTDGMILAQRLVFEMQEELGKERAEMLVSAAAKSALADGSPFRDALLKDETLAPLLSGSLERLLNPAGYTGLAAEQVDDTIAWLAARSSLPDCANQ